MNVIDLEILIPASPEFIWRFLGDPSALPRWQEDVTSVSFLSTQREGQGTRWRASSEKSNDIVVQVSAWYDTLGYEYKLMDGAKFAENQGRVRLHEVPDGTLVRWTFQYELGGVLGGLRNTMRLKRSTTNQLQASLRNLHQLIMQESGGISTHEAKASVREAPDVDERISYQPRHPSSFHEAAPDELPEGDDETATDKQPVSYDEYDAEPVAFVRDTDTKPNPVVISTGDDERLPRTPDPAPDDTKPIRVIPPVTEAPALPEPRAPEPRLPAPLAEPERPVVPAVSPPEPMAMPAAPALSSEARDTANLSVFEVFGLRKPSEARSWPSAVEPAPSDARDVPAAIPYPRQDVPEAKPSLDSPPDAGDAIARPGLVIGWRRQSRRRKTVIRSHN